MPLRVYTPATPIPEPLAMAGAGVQSSLSLGYHLCAGETGSNEDMQICLRRAARAACDDKYVLGSAAHRACVQRAMAPPRPVGLLSSGAAHSAPAACNCPCADVACSNDYRTQQMLLHLMAVLVLLAVVSAAIALGVCSRRL